MPSNSTTAPRHTGPDEMTRWLIFQRARGRCERCDIPVSPAHPLHHRRPRGMGGTRREDTNSPAALVLLCTGQHGCHEHVESHRSTALVEGWLVLQVADPATTPVLIGRGSRWVYLTADGRYDDNPPAEPAECDGRCLYSADVGVPGYGVAYAHPGCPLHDPGETCGCGNPERCNSPTHADNPPEVAHGA